jgi:hypothetical protein
MNVSLRVLCLSVTFLLIGCNRDLPAIGQDVSLAWNSNFTALACSGYRLTDLHVKDVTAAGIEVSDASLITSRQQIVDSRARTFLFFQDRTLSALVVGSYWSQHFRTNFNMGDSVMDTRYTTVLALKTDAEKRIIERKKIRVSHVAIAVDRADRTRVFVP